MKPFHRVVGEDLLGRWDEKFGHFQCQILVPRNHRSAEFREDEGIFLKGFVLGELAQFVPIKSSPNLSVEVIDFHVGDAAQEIGQAVGRIGIGVGTGRRDCNRIGSFDDFLGNIPILLREIVQYVAETVCAVAGIGNPTR